MLFFSQFSHSFLNRTALAFSVCPHKAAAPCSLLIYLFSSVPSTPAFPWDAETGLHAVLRASVCGKHQTCHTRKVCAEVLGSPGGYVHGVHLSCSCGFSLLSGSVESICLSRGGGCNAQACWVTGRRCTVCLAGVFDMVNPQNETTAGPQIGNTFYSCCRY